VLLKPDIADNRGTVKRLHVLTRLRRQEMYVTGAARIGVLPN
jgi:hypothetical protein